MPPPLIEQLRLQETGLLFEEALTRLEHLMLFWDGEEWHVTAHFRSGVRRQMTHEVPIELILDLVDQLPFKTCKRCGSAKERIAFSLDAQNKGDGRNRYCLMCEAERVKKHKTYLRSHAGATLSSAKRGAKNPRCTMSAAKVRGIRADCAGRPGNGLSLRSIADKWGVSAGQVCKIAKGQQRGDVGPYPENVGGEEV